MALTVPILALAKTEQSSLGRKVVVHGARGSGPGLDIGFFRGHNLICILAETASYFEVDLVNRQRGDGSDDFVIGGNWRSYMNTTPRTMAARPG